MRQRGKKEELAIEKNDDQLFTFHINTYFQISGIMLVACNCSANLIFVAPKQASGGVTK